MRKNRTKQNKRNLINNVKIKDRVTSELLRTRAGGGGGWEWEWEWEIRGVRIGVSGNGVLVCLAVNLLIRLNNAPFSKSLSSQSAC